MDQTGLEVLFFCVCACQPLLPLSCFCLFFVKDRIDGLMWFDEDVRCFDAEKSRMISKHVCMFFLIWLEVCSKRTALIYKKLFEMEREIVREVSQGDNHYLKNSARYRNVQISKAFVPLTGLIRACFAIP